MTGPSPIDTIREALEWMANYKMTGTEQTLHIDMQGKARQLLPALTEVEHQLAAQGQWGAAVAELTQRLDGYEARAVAAETALAEANRERDEWENRYEELLSEVGGVWPG